ncbi:MAG TPA: zf-HC2 domain-containing protein [Thermomicrobiaceae bacterium]|nr:zf-HC2 domain-containing protein [Thermomicrobiaceae bacterium]
MRCTEARLHLSALLDQELAPKQAWAVRAHLDTCPRCRAIYREYAANQRQLDELLRGAPYLPVAGRVLAATRQGPRPAGPSWLARGGERLLAGAALIALVALVMASALAIRGAGQHRIVEATAAAPASSSAFSASAGQPSAGTLAATVVPTITPAVAGFGAQASPATAASSATPVSAPADPRLTALQEAAGFALYAPAWLPRGVALGATEPPQQLPGFVSVFLVYHDASGKPLFNVTESSPYHETRETMPSETYDASVEVDLGHGVTGRYYEAVHGKLQLWWQEGPTSIRLGTDALAKDDLLRIARSMAPLAAPPASPTPAATPTTRDLAVSLARKEIVNLGGNVNAAPTAVRLTTLAEPHDLGLATAPNADLSAPVWSVEFADALVPEGCPGISASLCQHGQLTVIVTAQDSHVIGWHGAGGAWKTPDEPATPPGSPAPSPTPAPLAQADAVWTAVARGVGDTINPVLRPSFVPAGLQTLQAEALAPGTFNVVYSGPGTYLRIGVAGWNPPLCGDGCSQSQISVRGQPATLQVNDASAYPANYVWLWWSEPGSWTMPGLNQPQGIDYLISAQGLTPAEVQQVAASLVAFSAP